MERYSTSSQFTSLPDPKLLVPVPDQPLKEHTIVLTFGGVLYIIMSVAVVGVAVYLHLLDKKAE
jgi:hypothetical protein